MASATLSPLTTCIVRHGGETWDILAATMADVHTGRLEPKVGTAMAYIGTALLKAIETTEMEGPIEALEQLNKV
jgi:hypothetical protein